MESTSDQTIQFPCPKCGKEGIKALVEKDGEHKLVGSVCPNCGNRLSESETCDQMVNTARELAARRLREMFGKK